jgi:alcohol dehydrogenase
MRWRYHHPTELIWASPDDLPDIIHRLVDQDARVLVVIDPYWSPSPWVQQLVQSLKQKTAVMVDDRGQANPDVEAIDATLPFVRSFQPQRIIAIGGGSIIDRAKLLSAGMTPVDSIWHVARLGDGAQSASITRSVPLMAIPTTIGSGSEVTHYATLSHPGLAAKASVRHRALYPKTTVLIPELVTTLPWSVIVGGLIDLSCHAFEALHSRVAIPITKAYARDALRGLMTDVARLTEQPRGVSDVCQTMWRGVAAGLAVDSASAIVIHALSHPLTATYGIPHGLALGLIVYATLAMAWADELTHYEFISDLQALLAHPAVLTELRAAQKIIARQGIDPIKLTHSAIWTMPVAIANTPWPVQESDCQVVYRQLETLFDRPR